MKSNKGYSNRAKSGNKASLAHQRQAAARARLERQGGKRAPTATGARGRKKRAENQEAHSVSNG